MAETIRFTKVVEAAGQPEPYTLWQPPARDRTFQSALKEHRVMTVHRNEAGANTDFGEIGYVPGPMRELLVFPKSLGRFDGKRVIGIKFDMLKERTVPADQRVDSAKPGKPPKVRRAQEKPIPVPETDHPTPVESTPSGVEEVAAELKAIKADVRKALNALSKDQHVTAYRILKEALGE